MLKQITLLFLFAFAVSLNSKGQINDSAKVSNFKNQLEQLINESNEPFFKLSCESILKVINSVNDLSNVDLSQLSQMADAFADNNPETSPAFFESYVARRRSLILAWESPTDNEISYSWLELPANWDPQKSYPLYVQLHGYWGVAGSKMDYLAYPFYSNPSSTEAYAFEDGYHLSPWGRGNHWYEGFSETDIWECIAELEKLISINDNRRYLCGHSMGGYGAWNIGQKTANKWAALGIHAGALWWGSTDMLSSQIIENLSETPVYFVCGTSDGLLNINQDAYDALESAENKNIKFDTFDGGHDYHREDVERMYDWMKQFTLDFTNSISISKLNENIRIGPNPLNNQLYINLNLKQKDMIQVAIYNIHGQLVKQLLNNSLYVGKHEIIWEATNQSNGIYFCKINTGNKVYCQKVVKQ